MNKLKVLRNERGITQQQMAQRLNLSLRGYQAIENGVNETSYKNLVVLADFFDCSIDYLLGHETKNILHLDSFTPEQQELLDTVLQLTPTNCARVKAYADGLMTADEERETTIRKFRR